MKEKYNILFSKLNDNNCLTAFNKKGKPLFCIYKEKNGEYYNNMNPYEKEIVNIHGFQKDFRSIIRKKPIYKIIEREIYLINTYMNCYESIENEKEKKENKIKTLIKDFNENYHKNISLINDSKGDSEIIANGIFIGISCSSDTFKIYYIVLDECGFFKHVEVNDNILISANNEEQSIKTIDGFSIINNFVNECNKSNEVIICF